MKRISALIVLLVVCAGCAAVPNSVMRVDPRLEPAERITLGMTRAVVAGIMKARLVTGYEIDPVTGAGKPLEVQSLYSSELVDINGVVHQVDRYLTDSPKDPSRIASADLFDVVYRNGLVVAKGRDAAHTLRQARLEK
jgi:hypothetical protein